MDRGNQVAQARIPQRGTSTVLFGIIRTGNLDHRGVYFRGLFYYGDAAHALRRRRGAGVGPSS